MHILVPDVDFRVERAMNFAPPARFGGLFKFVNKITVTFRNKGGLKGEMISGQKSSRVYLYEIQRNNTFGQFTPEPLILSGRKIRQSMPEARHSAGIQPESLVIYWGYSLRGDR